MSLGVLSPNLTKKFQWEVSQIAKKKFPCAMLLGGLSANLNHLIKSQTGNTSSYHIFQVRSSHGIDLYCVELQGCFPKCSCTDWLENELPCKHVFHVLNTFKLTWHDPPEVFRFVFVDRSL